MKRIEKGGMAHHPPPFQFLTRYVFRTAALVAALAVMLAFVPTGCKEDTESETVWMPRQDGPIMKKINTRRFSESGVDEDKSVLNSVINIIKDEGKRQGEDEKSAQAITINYTSENNPDRVQFGKDDLSENGMVLLHDREDPGNITSPANVTIDGHGATIDLIGGNENSAPLITVGKGVTLTLQNIIFKGLAAKKPDPAEVYRIYGNDTSDNTAPVILVEYGGTLIMGSGAKITENHNMDSSGGGGVRVEAGGTLTMKSGSEINNVSGSLGGGVQADGTFRMDGGEIHNNISSTNGGGVRFGNGSFRMQGGDISGNIAKEAGGGIYMMNGRFEMNGGTISNNKAHNGKGGGGVFLQSSTFFMTGGDIKGNFLKNANGVGAGVGIDGDNGFLKIGGTIYGMKTADGESDEASDKRNYIMPHEDHQDPFTPGNGYAVYVYKDGNRYRYLDNTSIATADKLDSSKSEGWGEE
jgi:hypothetical protein